MSGYGSDGYNGWRNWATWVVALHLDNDGGYYNMVMDWVNDYAESGMSREEARDALAESIENMVDEEFGEAYDSILSPMIREFIDSPSSMNIDYEEIADGFLQDYDDGDDEDDDDYRSNNRKSATKKKPASKAGAKKPAKSQCVKRTGTSKAKTPAKKPAQSNNRKPRTTTGKAPTKKAPARRR